MILPRGYIGCKKIPLSSARLRKNDNVENTLGIMLNISPREVMRPKTLGTLAPHVFGLGISLGDTFTIIAFGFST